MTATLTQFEHWCTDGHCENVVEQSNGVSRVRRWRLSITGASWGFDNEAAAREFATKYGYAVA
jgi:hypothetical protein